MARNLSPMSMLQLMQESQQEDLRRKSNEGKGKKKLLKISRLNYSLHVGTFLYQYSQVRGEEHVLRNGLY